ncbi:RNA polymerase sigma factor [Patescibacteria group bacterium]|nr:RNA polymerase sigma factor [Patescibacteria group bacterium]
MSNDNKYSEKLLIFRAINGEPEAFGSLFDLYSRRIYRYIYFKVSNEQLAEDLASQAFLKVWEYIYKGKRIKNFKSFIYQTARNLVIDYYRSREKKELPLIYISEELVDEIKVDPDQEIDREALKKLLNTLNTDQKEIIILRYIEEMTIREISNIVDKSTGHVRVLIHRALKDLRKYIK